MVQPQMIRIKSVNGPTTLSEDETQGIFHLEEILILPGNEGKFEVSAGQLTLYLVEGSLTLLPGTPETRQLQQGDILHLPAGSQQLPYKNVHLAPAKVLQITFTAGESPLNRLVKTTEGEFLGVITDVGTIKLSRQDTQGTYLLMEWAVPPQGGVPIHAQGGQETFYILQGQFQFEGILQDGEHYKLSAIRGDLIHVPERAPHAYKNIGKAPGRMLVLTTPAGRAEEFFKKLGSPVVHASDFPTTINLPEPGELLKLFQEYRVQVLG